MKEANLEEVEVSISDLGKIKGFGEPTVAKLRDMGITTIRKLADKIEGKKSNECQDFLTPIQFKQITNYLIENPYV